MLLAHPEIQWFVLEDGSVVARGTLVPPALDRPAGVAGDRASLNGDPIAPVSGLLYRCPATPDDHVFPATGIEEWTTDLRARCPHDGLPTGGKSSRRRA